MARKPTEGQLKALRNIQRIEEGRQTALNLGHAEGMRRLRVGRSATRSRISSDRPGAADTQRNPKPTFPRCRLLDSNDASVRRMRQASDGPDQPVRRRAAAI
jgi:hypothetical protein